AIRQIKAANENFQGGINPLNLSHITVKPAHPPLNSLESELPQTELDITKTVDFRDFRRPNEFGITAYRHVFKMDEPGLLVSTGTERSFYGLIETVLASPPNYCQGLVIRDINPKVKAYVDFNVLLLRLATNVTEYAKLSHSCFPSLEEFRKIRKLPEKERDVISAKYTEDSIANRLKIVKSKLDADMTMDPTIKNYYLDNLEVLAKSYYEIDSQWKDWEKTYSQIGEYPRYQEDECYFNILQKYAKAGNIIATLGDIGDLEFLSTKKVSIVDISNIHHYVLLDFRSNQIDFEPKIISTIPHRKQTGYTTYQYKSMSKEKKEELRDLLHLLEKWKDQRQPTSHKNQASDINNSFSSKSILTYYSDEVLTALKKSMAIKTRAESPRFLNFLAIDKWDELTPREIKEWNDVLQKYPGNESFLIE
ncbi:MAG: hypothetical protein JSS09_09150, partial [Verrucomicrobia bacterium]|nr:hypothetical protein [Verrucomicrobiota bacterium]